MMHSQAVKILASMLQVTTETITIQDIDVALLCGVYTIYDHASLADAADDLADSASHKVVRDTPAVRRAVAIVNVMVMIARHK